MAQSGLLAARRVAHVSTWSRENPVPQNATSVDFLAGQGYSGGDLVVGAANDFRLFTSKPAGGTGSARLVLETGYYVHRNGTDFNPCSAAFEGDLPILITQIERLS
jgi:hypothetical protein